MLHNLELRDLWKSLGIFRTVKCRMLQYAGETSNSGRVLVGKPLGK
jgi:hypothetical protein